MSLNGRHGRQHRASVSAEEELALLLCGTQERRRRAQDRIEQLAGAVEFDSLSALLARQNVMFIAYYRLLEAAPESVPGHIRNLLTDFAALRSRRGLMTEALALQFQADLEREGVPTLPLKGPLLSRDLYGDPGMRSTIDLDLLVPPEQLDLAVRTIAARGYLLRPDVNQMNGLPLFHELLIHDAGLLLPVELHWRVHWYETRFSRGMLDRSVDTPDGRRARAEDELASLLLIYARDGFVGLRLAADIATWWDRHGHVAKTPMLDATAADYPEVGQALGATASLLEDLVGVPRRSLLSDPDRPSWRQRTAVHLANWEGVGDPDQVTANVTFVDWLLAIRGGWLGFARRTMVPPRAKLVQMYGLPEKARLRRCWWRLAHGPKLMIRYLMALWRIRGGRRWVPFPQSLR